MQKIFETARRCAIVPVALTIVLSGCNADTTSQTPMNDTPGAVPPATENDAAAVKNSTPKVGDIASDFELSDLNDKSIKLSSLSEKGSLVLVVLRGYPGYQCPL